jgi:hypothetical protein
MKKRKRRGKNVKDEGDCQRRENKGKGVYE